jgi:hypothetical protein
VFHSEVEPNSRKTELGAPVVVVTTLVVDVDGRVVEVVAAVVLVGRDVEVGAPVLVTIGGCVVVVVPAGQVTTRG